ncbi:MAG: lytic transglycosylase domain-containing protein [Pseudomonadota bacterium]
MRALPPRPTISALTTLVLCVAFSAATTAAYADIYVYVDGNGVQHLSNEKVDAQYRTLVYGSKPFELVPPALVGTPNPFSPSMLRNLTRHPNLKKYESIIAMAARDYAVEIELLKAVMAAESGFNPLAVSPKGAVGLMQLMPATAQRYGLRADTQQTIKQKLTDPETNIRLGARYLRDLQAMFPSRPELMIASYNAGEGAVKKYKNQIPPYKETRNYVQVVTQFYQHYIRPQT